MTLALSGQTGVIKVGYQLAAEIGQWKWKGTTDEWTITTKATSGIPFWMDRDTYDLIVMVGAKRWKWRGVTVNWPDCAFCEFTVQGSGRPEIS